MDAIDAYIPEPKREVDKPFLMAIEDVFSIEGRGTVATGRIERGMVKVGDEVEIVGLRATRKTSSPASKCSARRSTEGQAGDNVGCLLRGVKREDIERGQVLAKPGSITPHTKFEAEVYVPVEGRRRPSHAVLQRLPPAVLLPHDRRDRHGQPGRRRDVHARRQRQDDGRAAQADRHGRRRPLRHSRRRPHRRFGRGDEDRQTLGIIK
jgi:hypothetical protein